MFNNYFIINGIDSRMLDLIVTKLPDMILAKKRITSIEVDGRNGSLNIDEGTYASKNITIECILKEPTIRKIDKIKEIIKPFGTIELSTEPGRTYNYVLKNQIDFSIYLNVLNKFPLQIELHPFSQSKNENTKEFTSNSTIDYIGTADCYPIIKNHGIGSVTINGTIVEFKEDGITLDCDKMVAFKNNTNKSNKINAIEFPCLTNGVNSIELNGLTRVEIIYRERYL